MSSNRDAGHQGGGALGVDLAIDVVAHHEAVLAIEDHEPLGQAVHRIAQQRLGLLRPLLGLLQLLFGFDLRRDVASDAAIAGEPPGVVEQRMAVDADVPQAAVGAAHAVAEIPERPARGKVGPVRLPLLRRRAFGVHLPPPSAGIGLRRCIERPQTLREPGEAEIGVLFPEPVGRHLGEVAQPAFAFAQGALDPLELGDIDPHPGEAAVAHPALRHQQPAAIPHLGFELVDRLVMGSQKVGDPFLFASGGIRIVAGRQGVAHQRLELHPGHHQVRAGGIQPPVRVVAHHQAVVFIVDDEALGDAVHRIAQQGFRILGAAQRLHHRRLVGGGAAIAKEIAIGAEHRLAVDDEVAEHAVHPPELVAEQPERPARIQVRLVLPPRLVLRWIGSGQFPPRLADGGCLGYPDPSWLRERLRRQEVEPVLCVGFPDPVATDLRDVLEFLLTVAKLLLDLLTQRDVRGQRRLFPRELRFVPCPPPHLPDQGDKHAAQQQRGDCRGDCHLPGMRADRRQDLIEIEPDANDQRVPGNPAIAIEPDGMVDVATRDMNRIPRIAGRCALRHWGQHLADPVGAVRTVGAEPRPDHVVGAEQRETAAGAEIDRAVQRGELRRRQGEHGHAKKAPVRRIDAAAELDGQLVGHPANDWLADEQAMILAIEMDAEMLAVAQVDRPGRRIERAGQQPAIGTDDGRMDRRRQQGKLAGPIVNVETTRCRAHALRHQVYRGREAVELTADLLLEGGAEVAGVDAGVRDGGALLGGDQAENTGPDRQDGDQASRDDRGDEPRGTALRGAGESPPAAWITVRDRCGHDTLGGAGGDGRGHAAPKTSTAGAGRSRRRLPVRAQALSGDVPDRRSATVSVGSRGRLAAPRFPRNSCGRGHQQTHDGKERSVTVYLVSAALRNRTATYALNCGPARTQDRFVSSQFHLCGLKSAFATIPAPVQFWIEIPTAADPVTEMR